MKRYFNQMKEKQVVMIEFDANSVVRTMDICSLFGTNEDIVEITKSQYRRLMYQYKASNTTNLQMTISR